jgi:hypothetical protein
MVYMLNLLLLAWDVAPWAIYVVADPQKIVRFIRTHHALLALFRTHSAALAQELIFLISDATRIATNFLIEA